MDYFDELLYCAKLNELEYASFYDKICNLRFYAFTAQQLPL